MFNRNLKTTLKLSIGLLILILFFSCGSQKSQDLTLSLEDQQQIRQISKSYTSGWLESDTSKVINLFADSATIIPSGLLPQKGKEAIYDFWWPNDGSKTRVFKYMIDILEIGGNANMAYSYENGHLGFEYENGDFQLQRDSESYAMTIYQKNASGDWKIIKRIWSDIKN